MKMILAFIPIHRLDQVTRRLIHINGFPGMTVVHGQGFGQGELKWKRAAHEYVIDFRPNMRVEIVVPDGLVDPVSMAVVEGAHTDQQGGGKVFVLPVSEAVCAEAKERAQGAM